MSEARRAASNGRGGEIRTHDLYVPNVALYQAKLRPDFQREGLGSLRAPERQAEKERSARDQAFAAASCRSGSMMAEMSFEPAPCASASENR
jgi:hypothetical protein